MFSAKINLLYLLSSLFNGHFQANLFAKNFSKNSNLDDIGIFLPVFPSRTSPRLCNISLTLKMFRKVIVNLDFSKTLVLVVIQWWF